MLKFQKEKYGTIPGLTMNNGSNNYINNQTFMRYDLYEKVGEPEMADWGEAYGVHNVQSIEIHKLVLGSRGSEMEKHWTGRFIL